MKTLVNAILDSFGSLFCKLPVVSVKSTFCATRRVVVTTREVK